MLTDKFLRNLDYLRVSITDKCNLRCSYCMPSDGVKLLSHDEVLRNEEFIHFIEIFVGLGVKKIRFTGGEPLVRKGFIDIAAKSREMFPDLEICLTTNGVLLDDVLDDLHQQLGHSLLLPLPESEPAWVSTDRYWCCPSAAA